jgi:DNA-binding NarL/FixJ family response regulator
MIRTQVPGTKAPDLTLSRSRFIVIDDNPHMLELIIRFLRHFGCRDNATAESAEIALARCSAKHPFDAFICDFNMRPMNGIELLKSIRMGKHPQVPRDQPFLMLTGHGEAEVVRAAKALDVNGYVVKPLSSEMFAKAVNRALEHKIVLRPADEYAAAAIDGLKQLQ